MPLTGSVRETIHGTLVEDPYRWLEDRSLPETEAWILVQQHICDQYFESCPGFESIERRVRAYLDVEVIDQPAFVRDQYFYRKRSAGQEQSSICTRNTISNTERVLVDPFRDGRFSSVSIHRISPDGSLLAYERRRGGEDRKEIHFVEVATGNALLNKIPLGYARGIAFAHSGFFYCQEIDQAASEHRICYESFDSTEPGRVVFRVPRTKGGRLFLIGNCFYLGAIWIRPEGTDVLTDFWVAESADRAKEWTPVFHAHPVPHRPILCHDRILVLRESKIGNSEVVELSRSGEELDIVIPQSETPIRQLTVAEDRILVSYIQDGEARLESRLLNGKQESSVDLPAGGTNRILPVFTPESERLFYSFESFDTPPAIYEYQPHNHTSLLWHQRGPSKAIRKCRAQEVHFTSQKDGTEIPLTLVTATAEETPNLPRPTIMTSYGGFGASVTPRFSVLAAIMMELGFVFALPHIRGGGEFGKSWHEAGRGRNRQNSFDDFIGAAHWLCEKHVTSPDRLAIFGGSNSGLLVAAVATQRPELFRAVLCIAPLLDMVRYEYFDHATDWRREYGTVENPEDFRALYAYSPYQRIENEVDYPATMFVTGDMDDRCNPAHVRKMAARLQDRPSQRAEVIVDYSQERGHSPVLPLSVRINALTRRIVFLLRELGIAFPDGGPDERAHS